MIKRRGSWKIGFWLLIFPLSSFAQSNYQFWGEYMLNFPFANSFNLENRLAYKTVLDTPRWRSVEFTPTLEYSINQNFDILGGCRVVFTVQTENYNSLEVRPMIGTRIHLTPNHRILLRTYIRLEQRNFLNLETNEWTKTIRPRIRAESLIPINKKSYFDNKLLYGIVDAEWLFVVDDVDERFANRFRLRAGLGYRLSYSSRFEFIYMNQQSKNGMNDDFSSSDNIFRIRYKHYLRKSNPTKMSGSGD